MGSAIDRLLAEPLPDTTAAPTVGAMDRLLAEPMPDTTAPPAAAPVASRAPLALPPVVVSEPPAGAFPGVRDPSKVYEKNGHLVYDTSIRTRDGRVPTERLDQAPRLLGPGQTWEDLESSVLARPDSSFGADTAATASLGALAPDVRQHYGTLLSAARQAGVPLRVQETNRSQERQDYLFRKGRVPGAGAAPVTWTLTSNHTGGRALDLDVSDPAVRTWVQQNAPKYGFNVMGAMDPAHIEMPAPDSSMDKLLAEPAPAPPAPAAPAARPSLLARVGQAVRGAVVPTAEDEVRYGGLGSPLGPLTGPASRYLGSLAQQFGHDVGVLARGYSAGVGQPDGPVPTLPEVGGAALRTGIVVAGAPVESAIEKAAVSRVSSPVAQLAAKGAARIATGAGTGAAFTPNDPAVGAVLGGVAGAVPSGVEAGRAISEAGAAHPAGTPGVIAEAAVPKLAANRRALERAASTDALTGLANQGEFLAAKPRVEADPTQGFATGDLNGFKTFNDQMGHARGDAEIANAGQAARQAAEEAGPEFRAFRSGKGDEITITGPADRLPAVAARAKELYGVREHAPGVRTSISFGVGDTFDGAERAMNDAKAADKAAQGIGARGELASPVTSPLAPEAPTPEVGGDGTTTSTASRVGLPVVGAPDQAPPVAPPPTPAVPATESRAPAAVVRPASEPLGGGPERAPAPAPAAAADVATAPTAPATEPEYRYAGVGTTPKAARRVRDVVRSALQGPYAALEGKYDALKEAVNQVGASRQYADYLATQGVHYATEGLTPVQVKQFTNRLVADNLEAVNPDAPALAYHRAQYPAGVEQSPWFQSALAKYQQYIEQPIEPAAVGAGVQTLRRPSLGAYVKLLAVDPETGAPLTGAGGSTPRALNPRTLTSISAKQATGLAPRYSDALDDIVRSQSEKITKAARNRVFQEVAQIGTPLGPKEAAPEGQMVVGFDDHAHLVPPVGSPHRYAVPREVGQALQHLQKVSVSRATTPFAESKIGRAITGASLALSPGEAPYHVSAVANTVGRVPGAGVLDELPALVPVLGPRAQGFARVLSVDLDHPETRALEARLAKAGALRAPDPVRDLSGLPAPIRGIVKANHALRDLLFGPRGFDRRARLWLADRYLQEHPAATDEQLRVFVTDKVGNYVRENSGDLVNALQDIGLTSYARFAVPSIRNAVRSSLGGSGLGSRPALVARQLGRGLIGTAAGLAAYNVLASGHSPLENEPGHRQDIDVTRQVNAARALFGKPPITEPVYAKLSALDPQASRAMRATGMNAVLNGGSAPDAARELVNTDVLALTSPALRVGSNLALGKDPYVTQGGDLFQMATPGYTPQQTMRNRLTAALTGIGGSMEAAFGSGNPRAEPFGPVSRVTNAVMPQLFAAGTGRPNSVSDAISQNRDFDAAFGASLRRVRDADPQDRPRIAEEEAQKAAEGGFNAGLVKALLLSRAASPDAIYGVRQTVKAKIRMARPR